MLSRRFRLGIALPLIAFLWGASLLPVAFTNKLWLALADLYHQHSETCLFHLQMVVLKPALHRRLQWTLSILVMERVVHMYKSISQSMHLRREVHSCYMSLVTK